MSETTCPHGIRHPHPCRECEESIPDAEVKLFAKLTDVERERDEARARHAEAVKLLRHIAQNRQACMEAGLPTTGSFVSAYQLSRIDAHLAACEENKS